MKMQSGPERQVPVLKYLQVVLELRGLLHGRIRLGDLEKLRSSRSKA